MTYEEFTLNINELGVDEADRVAVLNIASRMHDGERTLFFEDVRKAMENAGEGFTAYLQNVEADLKKAESALRGQEEAKTKEEDLDGILSQIDTQPSH